MFMNYLFPICLEFRSHSKDIEENTVRHHFNELSNKIAASSDLLSSVTAGFYKYGIIDQNTKDEVNRKGGLAGAEMLLNHTQLKIKQSQPDGLAVLGSVINVLFDQGSLRDIVYKMEDYLVFGKSSVNLSALNCFILLFQYLHSYNINLVIQYMSYDIEFFYTQQCSRYYVYLHGSEVISAFVRKILY